MNRDIVDALEWRRKNPSIQAYDGLARLTKESTERILKWFVGHPYVYVDRPATILRAVDVLLWCMQNAEATACSEVVKEADCKEAAARFDLPTSTLIELKSRAGRVLSSSARFSPVFIAIEGIDGAGKSAQTQALERALRAKGALVETYSFPEYEHFFGRQIGRLLSGRDAHASAASLDPKSMSLWYALDRWESLSKNGLLSCSDCASVDYVLFNRFTLSSAIYQGARTRAEEREEFMAWVFELEHGHLRIPVPDLYVILDVSAPASRVNVSKKGHREYTGAQADVYEASSSLIGDARELYLDFAARNRDAVVVDCMTPTGEQKSIDSIHSMILQAVGNSRSPG